MQGCVLITKYTNGRQIALGPYLFPSTNAAASNLMVDFVPETVPLKLQMLPTG
jgi:hypothetical protein